MTESGDALLYDLRDHPEETPDGELNVQARQLATPPTGELHFLNIADLPARTALSAPDDFF